MIRWISGHQLLSRWNIQDFELYEYLRKGLPVYNNCGIPIINPDLLPYPPRRELMYEEIERAIRAEISRERMIANSSISYHHTPHKPPTEGEIKERAKKEFEKHPLAPLTISQVLSVRPQEPHIVNRFTAYDDPKQMRNAINEVLSYLFKVEDVNKFAKENGLPRIQTTDQEGTGGTTKYISGQAIVDGYHIRGHELFELVKEGLQPHNQITAKPIPPPNITTLKNNLKTCESKCHSLRSYLDLSGITPKERKELLALPVDKYREQMDIRGALWMATRKVPASIGTPQHSPIKLPPGSTLPPQLPDRSRLCELDELEEEISVLKETLSQIKDIYSWESYDLPDSVNEAKLVIALLLNTDFIEEEVIRVHGPINNPAVGQGSTAKGDKATGQPPDSQTDPEEFVRNLTFSIESDNEILIQARGKPKITRNGEVMGFRRSAKKTHWNVFLGIMRDGEYKLGSAYTYSKDGTENIKKRVNAYDINRQRLNRINKNLIEFLNKEYGVNIPQKYNLFERTSPNQNGKYKPKFQIVSPGGDRNLQKSFSKLDKEGIMTELKRLAQQGNEDTFQEAAACACQNTDLHITESDLKPLIKILHDRKEIKDTFGDIRYDPDEGEDPNFYN